MSPRRKRVLRWSALALLFVIIAAGAALFYVTRPAVQREFVLRALEAQGVPAELGGVRAGLSGEVRFEALVLRLPEARVVCKSGSFEVDWLPLRNNHARLGAPRLEGLEIDFSQKTPPLEKPAAADATRSRQEPWRVTATAAAAAGLLRLESGESFAFSLGEGKLDTRSGGELRFDIGESAAKKRRASGKLALQFNPAAPSAPAAPQSLPSRVDADGVFSAAAPGTSLAWVFSAAPDSRRHWQWRVSLAPAPGAAAFAEAAGELAPDGALTADARLDGFSSAKIAPLLEDADTRAWPDISALSGSVKLALPAAADAQAPVRAQFALKGVAGELARAHPSLDGVGAVSADLQGSAARDAAAAWRLELSRLDLRAAATGKALLESALSVNAPPRAPATFSVNATVHGDGLAEQPAWRELLAANAGEGWLGKLSASGAYESAAPANGNAPASAAPRLTLSAATLRAVRGAAAVPVFHADLLVPIDTARPFDAPDGKPVLRVSADDFPLELATPFLGGARLRGSAKGKITLARSNGGLLLATDAGSTLILRDVSFTDASGKPRLAGLHLQSEASFSFDDGAGTGWELNITKGNADAGDGRALAGNLRLAWDDGGVRFLKTRLLGDPSRLMRQPLLGGFENLASANLNLFGEYERGGACDVRLAVRDITGVDDLGVLKKISASAGGTFDLQKISLKLPARVEGELPNDIFLEVSPPAGGGGDWRATLKGEQLNTPDIQRLVKIFTPRKWKRTKEEEEEELRTPDTKPFWKAFGTGVVAVDIKKIILFNPPSAAPAPKTVAAAGNGGFGETALPAAPLALEKTTATLRLAPDALSLSGLKTFVAGGAATAEARLAFRAASAAEPYALDGRFFFGRIPFQNCISLFAPESDKALEGVFDIQGAFAATVPNHRSLLKKAEVNAVATSRNGRLRVLKMDNATLRTANDVLGVVSGAAEGVTDIFSGFGRLPSAKNTAPLQAFRQIQGYLDDFPFETARIEVVRKRDGSVILRQLRVANDQLSIIGEGGIAAREALAWEDSPLELRARFSARGGLAELLRQLRVLKGEPDADGFYAGPEFGINGSINSLKNDLLPTLLNAAKDAAVNSGVNLLPVGPELLRGFGL